MSDMKGTLQNVSASAKQSQLGNETNLLFKNLMKTEANFRKKSRLFLTTDGH